MPMYDENDPIEQKNRAKRRKKLIRFAVIVILLLAAAVIYVTQEVWLPKLRGIGKQYQTIVNDGQLEEGNFPIELSGGGNYQLKYSGKELVLLSDAYVNFYSEDGALLKRRQHAYTNPVMLAENERALIFESGGDEISVEDVNEVLYTHKFDNSIIFARLSADGYTAVVTTSNSYYCEIYVYDRTGACIYERKCVERADDISFHEGSKGCVISYIDARGGGMVTYAQEIDFKEKTEKWTSPAIDTFGLEVYSCEGSAFILGMDSCGYAGGNGLIGSEYVYDGDIKGGASSGGKSAVIINNNDRRKYTLVLFSGVGNDPQEIEIGSPLVDITISEGLVYVMSQESIQAYDFSGGLRSTAQVSDSYTGFVRSSGAIYLKGHNRIDKISYES